MFSNSEYAYTILPRLWMSFFMRIEIFIFIDRYLIQSRSCSACPNHPGAALHNNQTGWFSWVPYFYLCQWNELNIGEDYEIGRSVRVFIVLCTRWLGRNGGTLLWKLLRWRRYALSRASFSLEFKSSLMKQMLCLFYTSKPHMAYGIRQCWHSWWNDSLAYAEDHCSNCSW